MKCKSCHKHSAAKSVPHNKQNKVLKVLPCEYMNGIFTYNHFLVNISVAPLNTAENGQHIANLCTLDSQQYWDKCCGRIERFLAKNLGLIPGAGTYVRQICRPYFEKCLVSL